MTHLDSVLDPAELAAALAAGHVARRQHPSLPLSIYTYTRAAQYDRAWTTVTTRCRGLVVDDTTGHVVTWPFPKFFNTGEHDLGLPYAPPLPNEPFDVYDKVDGSLGIVFHYAGAWRVASKGSFTSDQARWAQARLAARDTALLIPGVTYLTEIVYPENRIVVDYGDRRDLVLLGAYDGAGREIRLHYAAPDWQPVGSVVRTWPAMPLDQLLKLTAANTTPDGQAVSGTAAEGFVLRYNNGLRVKAKHAEYVRLHKTLTGISERDVWRYAGIQRFAGQPPKLVAKALGCPASEVTAFAAGGRGPLDALLEQVPDEFDAWVRSVLRGLEFSAAALAQSIDATFKDLGELAAATQTDPKQRGEFAAAVQQVPDRTVRAAMFLRLDHKSTELLVWSAIRPAASDPFKTDEEG